MKKQSLVALQFADDILDVDLLGHGLINDTYLVSIDNGAFVLQRLNRKVFKQPEQIISNLVMLNRHLEAKTPAIQIPSVLIAQDGRYFYQDDDGEYWRALSFIDHAVSVQSLRSFHDARQVGFTLGHFHRLTSDLNPQLLFDVLPEFHIAPCYLKQYYGVLAAGPQNSEDHFCAEFIENHEYLIHGLEDAKQQGVLPLRVIHGDPKLDNFLFAHKSSAGTGLVDLDTVKPGLVHYDLGDCLRSCCHQPQSNRFDLNVCATILKYYLQEAGEFFSEQDYDYLYPAIRLIPFELGLRFYTDYLQGNRYFKVTEPLQNLKRAAGQFRLCASVIRQEQVITGLIDDLKRVVSTKDTNVSH